MALCAQLCVPLPLVGQEQLYPVTETVLDSHFSLSDSKLKLETERMTGAPAPVDFELKSDDSMPLLTLTMRLGASCYLPTRLAASFPMDQTPSLALLMEREYSRTRDPCRQYFWRNSSASCEWPAAAVCCEHFSPQGWWFWPVFVVEGWPFFDVWDSQSFSGVLGSWCGELSVAMCLQLFVWPIDTAAVTTAWAQRSAKITSPICGSPCQALDLQGTEANVCNPLRHCVWGPLDLIALSYLRQSSEDRAGR